MPVQADILHYYSTQAVRGPITKINQSNCSIAGPIFSKYWTGHCPEWSRTCVFAFFSRVINLLLTKIVRDRTGRISALGTLVPSFRQDPGPIFFQYGPRAWLIRYIYYMARQIRTFWLVLSWSGFCHTDRFRGNGHKLRIFCFRKPTNSKQAWPECHIINFLLT